MSDINLPEGKTPGEAAHDVVLALIASGHFQTAGKCAEDIFQAMQKAEAEFRLHYQRKLDQLISNDDKKIKRIWSVLGR
ncbi:hypothetical protein MUA04_24095 [Enterobacteriaceae bacterium H11S18]|uniref:hypothetical protein n=1 Tax=Dryocola clanedunensis TaxID=2925396 RepID=UPI0022F12687|nr:hypothetical protein [Dryocola clanedunensis]MCT4713254.1 hypothetical protein [Dryocola clanedunensis]